MTEAKPRPSRRSESRSDESPDRTAGSQGAGEGGASARRRPVPRLGVFAWPWETRLIFSLQRGFLPRKVEVVLIPPSNLHRKGQVVPPRLLENFDGFVIFGRSVHSEIGVTGTARLVEQCKGRPVAVIGRKLLGTWSFLPDNKGGIHELLTHLADRHEYRKLLHFTFDSDHPGILERIVGTRLFYALRGWDWQESSLVYFPDNETSFHRREMLAAERLGDVEAIVCHSDSLARETRRWLRDIGRDDVAVTGFDNLSAAEVDGTGLTTVLLDDHGAGFAAGEAFRRFFETGEEPADSRIPCPLVLRSSCGCPDDAGTRLETDFHPPAWFGVGSREVGAIANITVQFAKNPSLARDLVENAWNHLEDRNDPFLPWYLWALSIRHIAEEDRLWLQESAMRYHLRRAALESTKGVASRLFVHRLEHDLVGAKQPSEIGVRLMRAFRRARIRARFSQTSGGRLLPLTSRERLAGARVNILLLRQRSRVHGEVQVVNDGTLDEAIHSIQSVISAALASALHLMEEKVANERLREASQIIEAHNLRLMDESHRDPLTSLFNRRGFFDRVEEAWRKSAASRKPCLALFADLDGLKTINDTWGHSTGDEAIRTAANLLRSVLRGNDLLARLGGDEFTAFLPNSDLGNLPEIRQRLSDSIRAFNEKGAVPWTLGISLGGASRPSAATGLEELFEEADRALYEEKLKRKTSRA